MGIVKAVFLSAFHCGLFYPQNKIGLTALAIATSGEAEIALCWGFLGSYFGFVCFLHIFWISTS